MGAGRPHRDVERLLLRLVGDVGGDVAVFGHAIDDVIAPRDRFVALAERVVVVRPFRQGGEVGRFRDRKLVHRLVEIQQRRGGDPIGAEAEIDFVEIKLEDFFLRVGALDAQRQQRFLDLALERHLVGQQEVLGDLLGDGRGALRPAARAVVLDVEQPGARNAVNVDAGVLVEVLVLGGDEGVGDEFWNRLDRQIEAALIGVFGEQRAVGRMHPRHHRRLIILKLRIVRQVLGIMPQQAGGRGNADDEHDGSHREQKAQKAQQDFHCLRSAGLRSIGQRSAASRRAWTPRRFSSRREKAQFGSIAMKSLETPVLIGCGRSASCSN